MRKMQCKLVHGPVQAHSLQTPSPKAALGQGRSRISPVVFKLTSLLSAPALHGVRGVWVKYVLKYNRIDIIRDRCLTATAEVMKPAWTLDKDPA